MRIIVLLIGLGAAGCGTSVTVTPTNTPSNALRPRSADAVQVFSTGVPRRPYEEIALIEARQSSQYSLHDQSGVIAELRKKAGQHGCDAIIVNGSADTVTGHGSSSNGTGSSSVATLKGYRATCVVWTGSEPAPEEETKPAARQTCIPNDSKACVGPGGCAGGQACSDDGTRYSPCDCGEN